MKLSTRQSKMSLMAMMAAGALVFSSCEDTGTETPGTKGKASMQISLVDDPAMYDAVLIDVVGLEYKHSIKIEDSTAAEAEYEGEWVSVPVEAQVYDLLELNNGTEAILANIELEEGTLDEVRLILGSGNYLVIDGDSTALTVPSGSSSGLKIKIEGEIVADASYKLVLDFDAARSIVEAGKSGKFNLKPVIHATLVELDEPPVYGAISGVVWPDSIPTIVWVISPELDTASTMPEENGTFLIDMLEAENYTVVAVAAEEYDLSAVIYTEVSVIAGMTTDLDTIKLGQ